MTSTGRKVAAGLLLVAIGIAGAFGNAPGILRQHDLVAPTPGAPSTVPDPGAAVGSAAAPPTNPVPSTGDVGGGAGAVGSETPFSTAPSQGLPVQSSGGAGAATSTALPASYVGQVGAPHDALLLSTGSASGFAAAWDGSIAGLPLLGDDLRGGPPELQILDHLASGDLQARDDLQGMLLQGSALAGLAPQRQDYRHELGPDALERAVLEVYDGLGVQATAEQRAQLHDDASTVAPELRDGVALMLFAIADAQRAVARTLAALTLEEYQVLYDCAKPTDEAWGNTCADPYRAARIAHEKLDRAALAEAALDVLSAVQAAEPGLQQYLAQRLEASQETASAASDDANVFNDPLRLIEIGGDGNDIYYGNLMVDGGDVSTGMTDSRAQVFTLDFTGNDLYLARAGGTAPNPVLAVGDGNSNLASVGHRDAQRLLVHQDKTIAWGSLVSVSIDYSGDDTYTGGIGFQGAGILGIGILLELAGNDRYTATSNSQGAGDSGIGILYDGAGSDVYTAQYRSQGYGTVGGLGLLLESDGGDRYGGAVLVQGAGSNLGTGVLVDAAGNDYYNAVTSGTTASQGSSHLIAGGFFADGNGFDGYTSSNGARGFIMPAPAPYGVGLALFLDRGMVDTYSSVPGSNGGTWQGGNVGLGVDRS